MKLWTGMGAASLATVALSVIAYGQTTPTAPATCTTPPATLTALNVERAVPLANALTTLTPNAPANILAAIAGGALEIREILIYNSQLGTITSTVFLVAAGSPLPTPNFNFTTNVIQTATIKISQILTSCSPVPSLLAVGTVTSSSANGVYGNLNGASAAVSIGYTTDSPAKINNVAVFVSGVAVEWSAAASGTLTFASVPVVPPGSTGSIKIVVTYANGSVALPNTTLQAQGSPFLLDATGSTGTGALTFTWSTTSNSPVAFVGTGTAGQILVQFPGTGDYAILLKVTDSTGASNTFPLVLEYTGRPQ